MEDATRQIVAAGCKVGGSVISFNSGAGQPFGLIRMDGGKDHFVHATDLLDGNTLTIGARVTFVSEFAIGRLVAKQISGAYFDPNSPGRATADARNAARNAADVSAQHRGAVSGAQIESGGHSTLFGEGRSREKREHERAERRTREEVLLKRANAPSVSPATAAAPCPVRASLSLEGAMVRLTVRVDAAWRALPAPRPAPRPPPAHGSYRAEEAQLRAKKLSLQPPQPPQPPQHPSLGPPTPFVTQQRSGPCASAPHNRSWGQGRVRSQSLGRERSRSQSRDRRRSRSRSASAERRRSDRGQGESGAPSGWLQSERARGAELARSKKDATGRLDLLPTQTGLIIGFGGTTIAALKRAAGVTSVRVQNKDSARPYIIITGPSRDAVALAEKIVRALLRAAGRCGVLQAFSPVLWSQQ